MKRHKFTAASVKDGKALTIVCEYCGFMVYHSDRFNNENDAAKAEAANGCALGTSDPPPLVYIPGDNVNGPITSKKQEQRRTRDGYLITDADFVYDPTKNGSWKPQRIQAGAFKRNYSGYFYSKDACQEYCGTMNKPLLKHSSNENSTEF